MAPPYIQHCRLARSATRGIISSSGKALAPRRISAMKTVDPVSAQRMVNGMEVALRFMAKDPKGAIEVAKKEFPTLDSN